MSPHYIFVQRIWNKTILCLRFGIIFLYKLRFKYALSSFYFEIEYAVYQFFYSIIIICTQPSQTHKFPTFHIVRYDPSYTNYTFSRSYTVCLYFIVYNKSAPRFYCVSIFMTFSFSRYVELNGTFQTMLL